jgi:thioredoxin reductase (NADPH)
MGEILTVLGFLGVTALFTVIYVRRKGTGGGSPSAAAAPCPRCGTPVPTGVRRCPGCGIPQQIFELVQAGKAAPSRPGEDGPVHAVVRADMCVGCGTCADACPVPGAIRVEGKLAVVERGLCEGHGECAKACPVGAISVASGDSVQRVRVPDLSGEFESNVPGLYVVGELGGRGLIKNAVNEGKVAAEHAGRSLAARRGNGAAGDGPRFDLAVVGSGPAGLSAGLEALRRGLSYVILEQGNLADSIRKYPRHKLLLAEPVHIPLYGDLWVADASKESLLEVWETIIANTGLVIQTGCRVENVVREADGFRLLTSRGELAARRVILAMGRRGTPRRLEVPGEELDKVFYDIVEMEAFRGRRVLVVGGGDSAIESALGLANQPGTTVHLAHRGDAFPRIKDRNRVKLETAVEAGKVTLLLTTRVLEVGRESVALERRGKTTALPNDDVIVRIGGDPPFAFLEKIGVRVVEKGIPVAGTGEAHAV